MTFLFLAFALMALGWAFSRAYKNTKDVLVNKIKIGEDSSDKVLNILQLSDLHLENISISPDELYEKLKGEKIDLIALTGDFLDRKRTIPKLPPYLKALRKLNAEYGMYAVLGNHDYVLRGENLQKLIHTLEQHGVTILRNENRKINIKGIPVNIIGIDDFSTRRSDLGSSYASVNQGVKLVLTHDPNLVLHMKEFYFDYLLSGHFHGGQICYPKAYHLVKMGKLVRMNMIKGLHTHDGKPFYINEGLGQTGVNIRVGSRPEITLHKLSLVTEETASNPAV
ncbi:metallophosphoesterase [Neobacillus notoginsengisoli]|uniref:Metallophosphoesterase n=1 Tax=Neobacillus notoginsengisoli TaxID=1578198 RepID=A0A417YX52_9BACI|nr:metallophosphoesterase [Neobacillus notoginsengisoli]RHW42068.1 metallophosphoesterase [Neobacillus notoginsengisoli]